MATSWFFFKMQLLRQFLSELDEILTQCVSLWYVYMVLTDSFSGLYDVIAASEPNRLPACIVLYCRDLVPRSEISLDLSCTAQVLGRAPA